MQGFLAGNTGRCPIALSTPPTTVQSKDSVPAISETQEGSCVLAEDVCQTCITEESLIMHEVFTGYASKFRCGR